jgi:hypothetical protein
MTNRTFDDAFPSRYLTAADVEGKSFTASIRSVDYEKMRDGSEKPVVYFNKVKKACVLNKTKGKFLAGLAKSPKFDDWIGLEITVRGGVTMYQGDEIGCIKFERSAKGKKEQIAEEINDEMPEFDAE